MPKLERTELKITFTKFATVLMTMLKFPTTPVIVMEIKADIMMESVCSLAISPIFNHIRAFVFSTMTEVSSFASGIASSSRNG